MFDIIVSTKFVFLKFRVGGVGELQLGSPPTLGCVLDVVQALLRGRFMLGLFEGRNLQRDGKDRFNEV